MKYFDKLQVGIRGNKEKGYSDRHTLYTRSSNQPLDTNDFPLGYMGYFNHTKASENISDSIRRWCNVKKENFVPHIINNVPVDGFRFVDYTSRYSTSNKYVVVADPRGFTLEIKIDNVLTLLQEAHIIEGEMHGYGIWLRKGADNFLTFVGGNTYEEANSVYDLDARFGFR